MIKLTVAEVYSVGDGWAGQDNLVVALSLGSLQEKCTQTQVETGSGGGVVYVSIPGDV